MTARASASMDGVAGRPENERQGRNMRYPRNVTLRLTAALAMLALGTGSALAARPDTRAYSCSQVRGTVAQAGSIVLTTGPTTYARIVHNRGFCGPGETTQASYAPTLDNRRCNIGYTCIQNPFD